MDRALTAPWPTDGRAGALVRQLSAVSARSVYGAAFAAWLLTRLLMIVHQSAWPWMNSFVLAGARAILQGDWSQANPPALPTVVAVPIVAALANDQAAVAVFYLVGSLVQFGAFALLVRQLFPARLLEQALCLILFLVLPYQHSIYHFRDVPVLLASSGEFLLAAHALWSMRRDGAGMVGAASFAWAAGALALGVWSRTEALTFAAALAGLALLLLRGRGSALRLAGLYVVASTVVIGVAMLVQPLVGAPLLAREARFQVHTFLDSTPASWLSADCQANPTENCRDRDGSALFAPVNPDAGLAPLVLHHPLLTVEKTVRSALDNLWMLFGNDPGAFPGVAVFVVAVLAFFQPARRKLMELPPMAWAAAGAALATSVLPPLSWAPPHGEYHAQAILLVVVCVVPLLSALLRAPRGQLVAGAYLLLNVTLSAIRYTRYPGY